MTESAAKVCRSSLRELSEPTYNIGSTSLTPLQEPASLRNSTCTANAQGQRHQEACVLTFPPCNESHRRRRALNRPSPTREGVHTRFAQDGFPTDRVDLTSCQELGQAELVPREGVG